MKQREFQSGVPLKETMIMVAIVGLLSAVGYIAGPARKVRAVLNVQIF
jgi:hypothetical protein